MTVVRTAIKRQGPESTEGFAIATPNFPIVWASPTMLQPTTRQFVQWSLTAGGQITRNGVLRTETSSVADLVYHNHTLFQVNATPQWWYWNTTTSDGTPGVAGWVLFNLLGPINLSATTYAAGAVAGTTIAVVSVPMSANAAGDTFPGVWGGTLTLGGADVASFAISGTTLSVAPGHTLTNTQYNITISAQVAVGGFNVGNQIAATAFQLSQVAQGESVEAFSVTTVGPIVFASLTNLSASAGPFNQFALAGGGQITLNGVLQSTTTLVTELVYHDHTLFQGTSRPDWYYWNTSTSDGTPGTPGYVFFNLLGPIALSSLNYASGATAGTTVATISVPMSSNAAADTFPGPWGGTLTLAGADAANFIISGSNLNVAAGHTLSTTGQTYNITVSAQVPVGSFNIGNQLGPTAFALTRASAESAAGTTVTTVGPAINASPTPGVAGSGNLITITAGAQIAVNGTTIGGSNVNLLYYDNNHTAWQRNTAGDWWEPVTATSTGGGPFTDPRPGTLQSITLSATSFNGGSPSGTAVGAVGVTLSSGTFSGTLAISGTNAANFALSSTTLPSNLQTSGVDASGNYSINIIATQSGLVGSPLTVPFTITGVTPVISTVTLSNLTFTGGSPTGTVVGTVAVVMTAGTFTGALSLSGTNASSFQIVGTTLETNGVVAGGTYSINIVATQAGATGSPKTVPFTITGSSVAANKIIWGTETSLHGAPGVATQNTAIASTGQTITSIEMYSQQGWGGFFDQNIVPGQTPTDANITPAAGGFPMLAMSPFNLAGASTGTMAQCFTAVINGASNGIDTSINAMFTAFKNAGYTRMCIRPLWEFDDTQTSLISQYQSAFAHIANLAYSFVGMKIYTVFNPLPHGGVANWYPGDSVVDWIGIDESANWGGQGVYSNPLNLSVSSYTVGGCATFAAAGGRGAGSLAKPVAICEGGVANSAQTTGTGANNENFSTTLNGTINATQTSIVVSSASGFPGTPFPIQIGTEWLNVTNVSGTTLTINGTPGSGGTGRGYNGTTAASHNSGTAVTYGGYCAWLCNCLTAFKQTGATVILFGYYNGTDVGTDERWNTVAADTAAVVNFINLCPVWSGNLSTTGH